METALPARSRIGRKTALIALALVAAAAAYVFVPRSADLRTFDPATTARAETAMWRHYYEKRYVPLFLDLYDLARTEQGFSPWDSFSLALRRQARQKNSSPRARAPKPTPHCRSSSNISAPSVSPHRLPSMSKNLRRPNSIGGRRDARR